MPATQTRTLGASGALPVLSMQRAADVIANTSGQTLSIDTGSDGSITVNLTALDATGTQLARWALATWEDVSPIRFVETSGAADITYDDALLGAVTQQFFIGGRITEAKINIGSDFIESGAVLGGNGYATYVHETGHALGLDHPGDYNFDGEYARDAEFANDSWQATVMSYFSQTENTYIDADFAWPTTPMPADILAIQMLYGAKTTRAGDTVYDMGADAIEAVKNYHALLGSPDAAVSDDNRGEMLAITVFDSGGRDTFDLSRHNGGLTVDLAPGGISDMGSLDGNLLIAAGTVIEIAVTGNGDDRIDGNDAGNRLDGGLGNDQIAGHAGDDSILGRLGNDWLNGGAGNDNIAADAGRDTVFGGGGDDSLGGGGGEDRLYGNAGNDVIGGGKDNDLVDGGAGHDMTSGGYGADTVLGGGGDDTMAGSFGNDSVDGGNGNDSLGGGTGRDTIKGGAGNDMIGAGGDDDVVAGQAGDDFLAGSDGDDVLDGGGGNDTLNGGGDDDMMTGGGGSDVFVFTRSAAVADDVITDFSPEDTIRIHGLASGDGPKLAQLTFQEANGSLFIGFGGQTVELLATARSDIDGSDFVFA